MNTSALTPTLSTARRRLSVFLKLASIGLLILLLHIPLAMSRGVLAERQGYQAAATEEIARIWGGEQVVSGPVLAVPYVYRTVVPWSKGVSGHTTDVSEEGWARATAYFLPETLSIDASADPEVRRRGIYETAVYSTRLDVAGEFRPDFAAAGIEAERVEWSGARVHFGVSDLRGVRDLSALTLDEGRPVQFETSGAASGGILGLEARNVGAGAGGALRFRLQAVVQGTGRLEFVPAGKVTTVKLAAPWADPSFTGSSLPATRSVNEESFRAEWRSAHFGRGFPQVWTDRGNDLQDVMRRIEAGAFGVRFAQPVDGYSMVERARKYGVLFFVLVFTVFFIFEATAGLRIHPLQYGLVGMALCLFFVAFLALSEIWSVGWAYATAAAACTAMITLYARSFLRAGWRTWVIGSGLGATYGYLYFVLKSQDYALLAGTGALFGGLALVMFCTRRIDWYAVDLVEKEER